MRAVPSEAATQAHQHLQHELRSTGSDWKEAPVLQVGPRIRMGTDHQICGSLLPGLVNEAKHVQAVATIWTKYKYAIEMEKYGLLDEN